MQYVDEAVGSALYPKMIGCYELELHSVIEEIVQKDYQRIVDVGCAEGYYAVGLALRIPGSTVYAYDIDEDARRLCTMMADRNGVGDRVIIRGRCSQDELAKVISADRCLVVCDCEGFEFELLDPARVSDLRRCDILAELHEFITPGITSALLTRFATSHRTTLISSSPRIPGMRPEFRRLSVADQIHALGERPVQMQWAWMRTIT